MWGYRKKVLADVQRWRAEGWVGADGERKILEDIAARGSGLNLASALAILASVLLGFAAISFVAAHWNDMPRNVRLALLLTLIAGGYGLAGVFAARGQRKFSDAAILFSVAMFGASIALISQMFHIDGHPPNGVLLWMLGAILAGAVLQSNPALACAMVLASIWAGMESGASGRVHWPFLVAWAAITAAFVWQRWKPGVHISAVAISGFVITLGYMLGSGIYGGGNRHDVVALIGLGAAGAAIAASRVTRGYEPLSEPALGYGIAVAFAGLFAMQFIEHIENGPLVVVAALALAILLAAIWYGLASGHRGAVWLGYIGFSIEILALYVKTVGTILDTSLFFLVAGLIVAALAYVAWRLATRSATQQVAA